jgi:hypothetical protein
VIILSDRAKVETAWIERASCSNGPAGKTFSHPVVVEIKLVDEE